MPENPEAEAIDMTQNDADWTNELEESAQGTDLFEAPGSAIQNKEARESATDWESGDGQPVEKARTQRHSLQEAMNRAERASASASRAEGWLDGIAAALEEIRLALIDHVEVTEGPGGLFDDIQRDEPRFATEIALIREEHEGIDEALDKAVMTVDAALEMDSFDPDPVRRRVMTLLGRISLHRQRGADLVYDAYNVDIATAD